MIEQISLTDVLCVISFVSEYDQYDANHENRILPPQHLSVVLEVEQ